MSDWPCAIIPVFIIVFLLSNPVLVNINSIKQISPSVLASAQSSSLSNVLMYP